MVPLKTIAQIRIQQEAGSKLKKAVAQLMPWIKPGITTNEIDRRAQTLIRKAGGEPSFQKVEGYKWSTCLSVNEQIVHTPPSNRVLKEGDVLTVDIGLFDRGFHTDYANTVIVGETKNRENKRFLETGRATLKKAIGHVVAGGRLGEISKAIQEGIEGEGYSVIRELTGHGVGRELHEDPYIPGFLDRPVEKTMVLKAGMVLAIEVIYARGGREIAYEEDGWSIVTRDRSLSACFEHTVAIFPGGTVILT